MTQGAWGPLPISEDEGLQDSRVTYREEWSGQQALRTVCQWPARGDGSEHIYGSIADTCVHQAFLKRTEAEGGCVFPHYP